MARQTMVVNVTRGRMGFTISDASREWELIVILSNGQDGRTSFAVVLAEVDSFVYQRTGHTQTKKLSGYVVGLVDDLCRVGNWDELGTESLKQAVRRQLSK